MVSGRIPDSSHGDMDRENRPSKRVWSAALLSIGGLIFGFVTYLHGLGSIHILRNGDELVYMHITRVTSMANRWLPIEGIPGMSNTKPPLLFWQGLLSTQWGNHWSVEALRWPSLVWTFGTAVFCGLLGWRLSGKDVFKGVLAAIFYLAFYSTYRYGRPYLTNPPETFWVFACFFVMLWWKPRSFDSRFVFPTFMGVLAGMALLTKSFAQIVPIGLGICLWHLHVRGWRPAAFARYSLPGIIWMVLLSLGIFSLWFFFDPDPVAIWREFVIGENMGKMANTFGSWIKGFLWSGDTVWSLAGSWFANAGLLAFPLFGLMVESWKHRRTLSDEEKLLWIWVFAIFIVFCIPSQRSGRYLLEAMPALAVLMATRCQYVWRAFFLISLGFAIAILLAILWMTLLLANELGLQVFPWWHVPVAIAAILFAVTAICKKRQVAMCTGISVFAVYLSLSSFLSVFDAPLGVFDAHVAEATNNRVVWVPEKFRSKAETHRFLLPNAVVRGYPAGEKGPDPANVGKGDLLAVRLPLDAPAPADAIGSRINVTSRHKAWQIREMAMGKVKKHLFCREWLVPARSAPKN